MEKLKFKLMREGALVPEKATPGSAAYDLHASLTADVVLKPGETALILSGVAVELPGPNYAALVLARSGLAIKSGISLANGVGLIDSDYRGEICVGLTNNSGVPFIVKNEDRIAQLMIINLPQLEAETVSELGDTKRGEGGFGSTGVGKAVSV